MKVILKKNFKKLGYKNDIVEVKKGFGLNFLIRQGFADYATSGAQKNAEENSKQQEHKQNKIRNEALNLAKKINGTTIVFEVNCDTKREISSTVSATRIIDKIKQQFGCVLSKNDVVFKKEIDTLGEHPLRVKFFKEVFATVNIVIKQKGSEQKK